MRSLFLLLLFTLALPADAAEPASAEGPIRYSVDIEGAPGGRVASLLRETSQLVRLRDSPPMTFAALGRRIAGDERRFRAALESEGYYNAEVTTQTTPGEALSVKVTVTPGPRYTVSTVVLDLSAEDPATAALVRREDYARPLQDIAGEPARAADVIEAEDDAIDLIRAQGFPFARRGDRGMDVDHEARTVSVTLPVVLNRRAVFGSTSFRGMTDVKESHLRRLVPWQPGEIFAPAELEALRNELILASLFSSVRVEPAADSVPENGAPLDVNVTVTEGPHRSIGAGVTYARDKGAGASGFWQHRNLFGAGEKFEARVEGTQLDQTAGMTLEKPAFLAPRQKLKLGATGHHQDTDAFTEWSGLLSAGLERQIGEFWRIGGGTTFEYAILTEDAVERRSYLTGIPLFVTRGVDERLLLVEMTRGWRWRFTATPYFGSFAGTATFLRAETEIDVYLPVTASERFVAAGRLKLGSILGEDTANVPANKRFYAGGGGSVRGYGYQMVGPLDAEGDPAGGRGLAEASLEARVRVTETIGIVPFVDAGMVSRGAVPGETGGVRFGAGIGARYYTAAGPLRVDFAVPINRRSVDKSFQFYISFGQAF